MDSKALSGDRTGISWDSTHSAATQLQKVSARTEQLDVITSWFRTVGRLGCDLQPARSVHPGHPNDHTWPLLESLEELGAECWDDLYLTQHFAAAYADVYSRVAEGFQAQMVWGINEFFERGRSAERLGLAVAMRLLDIRDGPATNVIFELCRLRPGLRTALRDAGYPVDEANGTEGLDPREVEALASVSQVSDRTLADNGTIDFFWPSQLDELIKDWDVSSAGERGIRAMTAVKRILKSICGVLTEMKEAGRISEEQTTILASDLCGKVLDRVNLKPDKSAFLAIEALEIVRDKHPQGCVRAMSQYLAVADERVLRGIFVCMAEGLEDVAQREGFLPFMKEFRARVLELDDADSPAGQIQRGLDWFDRRIASSLHLRGLAIELLESTPPPSVNNQGPGDRARLQAEVAGFGVVTQTSDLAQKALGYLDSLYGFAVTLTRVRAEAEDLVQETYLRALKALDRRPPEENMKGWLFVIMRNIWLNQIRDARRTPEFVDLTSETDEDELAAAMRSPARFTDLDAILLEKLDRERVRDAIERLPAVYRDVIVLRDIEGFSYQEMAGIIGAPAGTVMSRLARARKKLRFLLVH